MKMSRSWRRNTALLVLVALPACASPQQVPAALPPWQTTAFALPQQASAPGWNPQQEAGVCAHFAVATAHPLATRAAEQALKDCGSAVDALVAASLVLTVVAPQSTGIGGGGFAVVVDGTGKKPPQAFDFRETAPAATQLPEYLGKDGRAIAEKSRWGGLAVGVPGYVAGLWTLHRQYGRLPWKQLAQPASDLAARGFPVGRDLGKAIALMTPHLNPAALAIYAPEGKPLKEGDVLRQPALARTLQRIANEGPGVFYHGAIADDLVEAVQAAGGHLTREDLAGYEVRTLAPLQGQVFGMQAVTMPQPSAGGAQVLAMAETLDRYKPALLFNTDQGITAHVLIEAMRRSFVLRLAFTGDAAHPAGTLDEAFAPAARTSLNETLDLAHATPTAQLPKVSGTLETGHNTSHVAILDGRGLAVASTHTVNLLLGSGVMAARTGILLNDEMDDFSFTTQDQNAFGLQGSAANLVRPGARPVSSMSPVILTRDGQPVLVAGTPGGTHIPTTVLQILAWRWRGGLTLAQAMAHPRVHHQALPDVAEVENGPAGDEVAAELQKRGHTVVRKPAWCNAQAVEVNQGVLSAVSDPRGEGGAIAR
jgi:gamma-glutamyltranspeptidase/glutathione hydrolase